MKTMLDLNAIHCGACEAVMQDIDSDSVDCIVTDPPYGLSFMSKNWDKTVPSIEIWQECLRVLKSGAFAFVMCIPRQDCLARMICRLEDAGFTVTFSSIYWTYASGFPKSQNLSKAADTRAGVKREVIGKYQRPDGTPRNYEKWNGKHMGAGGVYTDRDMGKSTEISVPSTLQAKALDGAYGGFQPKPAVEVIIVAMKPIEEKAYLDQALSNGHGCTWLDDCRIPFEGKDSSETVTRKPSKLKKNAISYVGQDEPMFGGTGHNKGRFLANVICEDNVLDDGIERKSGAVLTHYKRSGNSNLGKTFKIRDRTGEFADWESNSGGYSRYFSLDAWFVERIKLLPKEVQKTFPWLIVPKASKSEKNRGLEDTSNTHATVKPIKLMSWLITLASREGDTVLDPFCGSGTTAIAAKMLGRQYIGIEREEDYCEIARKRISAIPTNLSRF